MSNSDESLLNTFKLLIHLKDGGDSSGKAISLELDPLTQFLAHSLS